MFSSTTDTSEKALVDIATTIHYDMEEFLEKNGYPKEKWMKDRISHAVTRFQAIWRGYLYKQAYPWALKQKKALEAININILASVACEQAKIEKSEREWRECAEAIKYQPPRLGSGEGDENEHDNKPVTIFNIQSQCWYGLEIGNHCEVLFNRGKSTETIYSGEIMKIQGQGGDNVYIWVDYHHNRNVKRYHWKKFKLLKEECEEHKRKLGIEAKLIGRVNTARICAVSVNN